MKEKKLLIVERCNNNLNIIEEQLEGHSEKSIVLSGIFTTFDQKNRNGRIYESADFLPHVDALKEAIKHRSLLGEMDHPHSFETTLANASHVIESLEFDPAQNAIIGKIRLLNTTRGRDAQALVRDGIPLHISSRAAGTVNESGKVRLQQLFTYDLVAEPGFANAVLTQVNEGVNHDSTISDTSKNILIALNESHKPNLNENYGIDSNDNVEIYEVSEDANTELTPAPGQEGNKPNDFAPEQAIKNNNTASTGLQTDNTTNNTNNMEGQYILMSDFQKYSEHLAEIITDLQNAVANYKTELANVKSNKPAEGEPTENFNGNKIDNSMIADLVAKEVASKIPTPMEGESDVAEKAAAMEEKYKNLEAYVKYLAETVDKSITHQDYIAEEANKIIAHNNYLAENMNQMVAHQDYLAENMNKMIAHQDYLAENLNDTIGYQNYVAEMLDKSIDYSNMLAEEQNKTVAYNNYLSEKMNQMVAHQDYLAENLDTNIKNTECIEENVNKIVSGKEIIAENNNKTPENVVNEKKESKPSFDSKKYQCELSEKLSSLISTVKTQYEEAKKAEAEALEESKKNIGNEKNFTLINYLPARLNEKWSKLSDKRKEEILAESKMFVINNAASAEYFWNTRDMRENQIEVEKVEEQKTAQPAQTVNENVMNNDRYKSMMEQIKSRMRRY